MKRSVETTGLCAGFLLPHPPVLIPVVGQGREAEASATINACREAAALIARIKPETLVILSPHAPLFRDYVYVYNGSFLSGNFANFGASFPVMRFEQDTEFRTLLVNNLNKDGIQAGSLEKETFGIPDTGKELDHGVLVPLHFINEAYSSFKIVALASASYSVKDQYRIGVHIRKAADAAGRRVCIIASGDMSHKVNRESPYGAVREGALFDKALTDALRNSDTASLLTIDPVLREKGAECGYGSIVILCGAFDQVPLKTELIGYEAPFGIGYCVASFIPEGEV